MILLLFALDTLSLNLNQVINLGISRSLSVSTARTGVDLATIDLYDGLTDLLPTLSSYYEIRHGTELLDTTTYTYNLSLTQTVLNTTTIYQILSQLDLKSLARLTLKDEIGQLVYELTRGYIRLLVAFAMQKSLGLAQDRADENYRIVAARYQVGEVSRLDLLQADLARTTAERDRIENENRIEQLETHLSQLLDTNIYLIPTDTLPLPEADLDPDSLIPIFFGENLAIRKARLNRSISGKELLFAHLALLPTISLFLSYTYSSYDPPGSIRDIWDNRRRSYGIRIDFPIFNLKDILIGIMRAKVKQKRAEIELRTTRNEAWESFSDALRRLRLSRISIELGKKGLDAAREAFELARERYRTGTGSLLSLLTAQTDLTRSETQYLQALSDYHITLAEIGYLLGRQE
ncbi:hypothetical protein DRP53_02035 [candidate division WOR-3 bacterium]|uniref:TolC family protein n=1 Tax=candidate division WOR-3 bacterium TaxID=2052148 RepID=A0A660SKN8_UNCW3|nr:MAG: hypothetical protein DRP53_02035 [candidate division WOR-3 bacterium]